MHLLALAGVVPLVRRYGRWALAGVLVAVVYLFLVGSARPADNGASFPARYQLAVIPLAAIPLYVLLQQARGFLLAALPLALLIFAMVAEGVGDLSLLLQGEENSPGLNVAEELAFLWPATFQPQDGSGSGFPAWPHTALWLAAIAALGVIAARADRRLSQL